jgi:hypothetical protein
MPTFSRALDLGDGGPATLTADTVRGLVAGHLAAVPRVLTDQMRRAIWRAQAEHVAWREGMDTPKDLVAAMVELRINDPKQPEVDEAAWRAVLALATPGAAS